MSFHLLSLEAGSAAGSDSEDELRDRILDALEDVEPGETAFVSELPPQTPRVAGRTFLALVRAARDQGINIVAPLALGGELLEDLPGHDPMDRYHAMVCFTRFGAVHVPQAKLAPAPYERIEINGAVTAYTRSNLVMLDLDDEIVPTRFLFASDLHVLPRLPPRELACQLLVVLGRLPPGAEKTAQRVLGLALAEGVAQTAIWVNSFDAPPLGRAPVSVEHEEVLDAQTAHTPGEIWTKRASLRAAFHVYDAEPMSPEALATLPRRGPRIPVQRGAWEANIELNRYPVTIMF